MFNTAPVVCSKMYSHSNFCEFEKLHNLCADVKPFGCHLCDKAFKQKQHLDRHLTSHSGEQLPL